MNEHDQFPRPESTLENLSEVMNKLADDPDSAISDELRQRILATRADNEA